MDLYDAYLQEEEDKARKKVSSYATERLRQAKERTAQIDVIYEQERAAAAAKAEQSVAQIAAQYEATYDANAIDELVARRRAAESIANSNLANSGLNNTQQTAISLSRSRADAMTTVQRQAAIDKVMQALDELNADMYRGAAAEKAAVFDGVDDEVDAYRAKAEKEAAASAEERYEDGDALSVGYGGSALAEMTYNPSLRTISAGALAYQRLYGDSLAGNYLDRMLMQGKITSDEWDSIITKYNITPHGETPDTAYEYRVHAIMKTYNEREARLYVQYLLKHGAISRERADTLREYIAKK